MPPPFGLNTKILEHIEPKKITKISGEGAQPPPRTPSSVGMGRGHPRPTLHPIGASGASNLASLALVPPSQNPKYATGDDLGKFITLSVHPCLQHDPVRQRVTTADTSSCFKSGLGGIRKTLIRFFIESSTDCLLKAECFKYSGEEV